MNKDISDVMRTTVVKKGIDKKTISKKTVNFEQVKGTGSVGRLGVKASVQDIVTISSESIEAGKLCKWAELVNNMPDVRRDKVDAIKRSVDNGDYLTSEKIRGTVSAIVIELDSESRKAV